MNTMKVRQNIHQRWLAADCLYLFVIVGLLFFSGCSGKEKEIMQNMDTLSLEELSQQVKELTKPSEEFVQSLNGRVEKELNELRENLNQAQTILEIEDLDPTVTALKSIPHTTLAAEIDSLVEMFQKQRHDLYFSAVEKARASNWEGFKPAAETYLEKYPDGQSADQVKQWQEELVVYEKAQFIQKIINCDPKEKEFLKTKADLIEAYLNQYPDEPDKDNRLKAIELARKIYDTRNYTVHIKECGAFKNAIKFKVVVEYNNETKEFASDGKVTTATWSDAAIQFAWEPLDTLKIFIKYSSFLSEKIMSSMIYEDGISVSIFSGRKVFSNLARGWRDSDFTTPESRPYILFEVEGFSDTDWKTLDDFIMPGQSWRIPEGVTLSAPSMDETPDLPSDKPVDQPTDQVEEKSQDQTPE